MSDFEKLLTEKPFDLQTARNIFIFGKSHGEVRTRDYRKVRILTFLVKGDFPIAGIVDLGDRDVVMQWTLKGKRDLRDNVTTNGDLLLLVPDEEGGDQ